jgi:hypothetical protein
MLWETKWDATVVGWYWDANARAWRVIRTFLRR